MEKWRPVPGFEGLYEVSDCGRVRSYYVRGHSQTTKTPRILSSAPDRAYRTVNLRQRDGSSHTFRVHQIVALAFLGPAPTGMEVAHCNGIGSDNSLANLEYATPKRNHSHKRAHGTLLTGERHPLSRLTATSVAEIRRLYASGVGQDEIASRFGVSQQQVSKIVRYQRWKENKSETAILAAR